METYWRIWIRHSYPGDVWHMIATADNSREASRLVRSLRRGHYVDVQAELVLGRSS